MSRLVSGDSPNITSGFPRKSHNEKKNNPILDSVVEPSRCIQKYNLNFILILGFDPKHRILYLVPYLVHRWRKSR